MELQVLGSLQSGIAMQLYVMYYDSDKEKSLEYLKKAASLGSIYGMEQLGSDYLYGNGVEKDINQGKQWLKKAFDNGSPVAEDMYCGSLSKEKQKTCKF
jgi:TPR repeat protein